MKTSNKLLTALLALALFTLIGANVALKAEYDRIDFNDPFYGLSSQRVKPFRVLKLEGNLVGLLKIETGKVAEIRQPEDRRQDGALTYRTQGDTLVVRYQADDEFARFEPDRYFDRPPAAIIRTPTLQTLMTNGTNCNLHLFNGDQLTIIQQKAAILLTNSTITNLVVRNQQGSEFRARPTNRIGTALITARDSSAFVAERDVFGTLTLQTDSLAMVKVPGNLLKKMKP